MSNSPPQLQEDFHSLGDLIEKHLAGIEAKISRNDSIADIAQEVAKLNDLLVSYQRRDELLERLLDTETPSTKRKQIRAAFEAARLRMTSNRVELERLHAVSHELLLRSAELVLRIQRRVDKESHQHCGYALELCSFCRGFGAKSDAPCPACDGKRSVLVFQPANKCPRCNGDGHAEMHNRYISELCLVCRGTGWVMTKPK